MNSTFTCNLCGKEFSRRFDLNRHILGVHEGIRNYGPNRFKCNLCPFETYMKSGLLVHSRTHTNERPFKCTIVGCELAFKDEKTVREHFKHKHSNERPLKCEFQGCQFTAKTLANLYSHKRVHSDNRRFACPNPGCNFRAKTWLHITRHTRNVNSETKLFACSKCEFKYAREEALGCHMAYSSTTIDFKCSHSTCEKPLKHPLDLKRHVQIRHGERIFQCDHRGCGRKYGSANVLHKHKLDCHSKKSLTCPERERNYETNHPSHLARHISVHQRRNARISCWIEGCDYKGKNNKAMEVHMRGHETLLACPENDCSQFITSNAKLKDQVTTSHKPSARPFHCSLCFKHFRALSCLQEHCVSHTKEKQFMCGYCDYSTSNHHQAKNHISLVHPNVQFPFIAHHQNLRECIRCKVILPSCQFLVHSVTHATPLVILKRLETKSINFSSLS